MSINERGDQSAVSNQLLLAVTQRLLDAQLRLLNGGENEGRAVVAVSSSATASKKKEIMAAAAKMKKKRNKRNKAAAKHKGTKRMSWLDGGIISLLMMAAFGFGSITTLSHIPQSDGSSESNKAPPTLPPSASTSLRQRDLQSSNNMASMSPASASPFAAVVQAPVFLPADVSHRRRELAETVKICTEDTEGWYDERGDDCSWYEAMDVPGCPHLGNHWGNYQETVPHAHSSTVEGTANDNCCYCKNGVVSTPSPAKDPCVDEKDWKDKYGMGCEWYQQTDVPGCHNHAFHFAGDMGPAAEKCCYCKDPTCEDYKWKCQEYTTSDYWWTEDLDRETRDRVTRVCDEASSCSCETDHFKIVTNHHSRFSNQTVGLYNECKCDFWLRLCEEKRLGEVCDYAAEYCCGDYKYTEWWDDKYTESGWWDGVVVHFEFTYLNSPLCYCDFFNYAQNEFGHTLKPKALNINKEFENPCDKDDFGSIYMGPTYLDERESLEAIYNATNGQNWKNNDGWTNKTVFHAIHNETNDQIE
eukprot:scaffold33665_cov197-Skeletonema_dohrnii-CCMP3373.AAC.1